MHLPGTELGIRSSMKYKVGRFPGFIKPTVLRKTVITHIIKEMTMSV